MTRAELPERIETERLVLRVRTVADAEDIYAYASLPEVSYPAGFPPVKTLEDEIYYLEHILPERNEKENLPAGYGIVVKGTDTIMGSVDFNHRHEDDVLEIGYTLHPDYWGRGYVPEATRALIDLGFKELGLHKIELSCFGYNLQSQRVAEKLGFTLEARIRDRKDAQGNRCDDLRYGLLKSEWEDKGKFNRLKKFFESLKKFFESLKIFFESLKIFFESLRNNILTLLFSISLAGGISVELSIILRKLKLDVLKDSINHLPFNMIEIIILILTPILLLTTFLKLPKIKKRFKVSIVSLSIILIILGIYTLVFLNSYKVMTISNLLSLILFYLCFNIVYIIIELLFYLYNRIYNWLLDKNSTVEPAKLTLVWTVIAFILGMFISKK